MRNLNLLCDMSDIKIQIALAYMPHLLAASHGNARKTSLHVSVPTFRIPYSDGEVEVRRTSSDRIDCDFNSLASL
jgi:hypothetical protein